MKSLIFSLVFALGTIISVQAQDDLYITVTNNTSGTWTYKMGDGIHSIINQAFAPGSTTTFMVNAADYQFPLYWGARDYGGCYADGNHARPSAPLSTDFHCTNSVLSQAFASSSGSELYLFISME